MDLPASYNLFIGRTRELGEIEGRLRRFRLVTLTGPGGCGKTRLALEVARQLATAPIGGEYPDGVTWCDLASLADPAYVLARLVSLLGLTERADRPATVLITAALQSQKRLVILDNCEHLLAACAALAEAILANCPHVTLLATSLQPLGLPQESFYSLPPLSVPELPALWNQEALGALGQAEAVRLFLQRAREVFPGFELTLENGAAVVAICRRLDGLPLAIELAAARARLLAPAQILERLDDAFGLLTRGRPEALPKHQTLRAALEWSYRLLSATEQVLLRRLAVFAGSFDVEMVEVVCAADLPAAPLEVLTDLADKSFVSIFRHDARSVRYGLLETLRQYAREQLEAAGEREALAARLLAWCLAWAERTAPELERAGQAAAFARLEQEHDNLRAALQVALDTGRGDAGLRLAAALERFWLTHAHPSEGRAWLSRLLAGGDLWVRPAVRARALSVAGLLAHRQNDNQQAEACLRESLSLWQGLEDEDGIALALNKLGDVLADRGQPAQAMEALAESLRLRRALGDDRGVASVLISQGAIASTQGDHAAATAVYAEALNLCRQLGDQWMIAVVLNNLGVEAIWQSDWGRAEALLHETLAMRRALGDQNGAAIALSNLAEVAMPQHELALARALARESAALYRAVNNRRGIATALLKLADMEVAGDRAARLLGMAEGLYASLDEPLPSDDQAQFDAILARWQAQLDERTLLRLRLEGRALPLADALAYALSEPAEVSPASVECHITAFGKSAVLVRAVPLADADWRYTKARELFFYLLTRPRASKEQLGLALYPEASPSQVRARLHRVLHHARRALGHNDWILFDGSDYALNRERPYWYDVEQFEQRVRGARAALTASPRDTALAIRQLQVAASLYAGDFLPEIDADWARVRREELRRLALEALMELGSLLLAEPRLAEAIRVYQRVLELDNYLEVAHRALMRCYAHQGEAGRARRHFQQLSDLLRAELGAAPSPETVRLDEQIRAGQDV